MTTSKQSIQPLIKTTNYLIEMDNKKTNLKAGSLIRWVDDGDLGVVCSIGERGFFVDDPILKINMRVFWLQDGFVDESNFIDEIEAYAIEDMEILN
tara:strand:+ start:1139 stop:1426 length:288 start_codon:yes stop_codon:yes gene_type:complete